MKQLPLKSESFIYVEKSFKQWLDILGYAPSTVYQLPLHARELFNYLEQQGCSQLNQITTPLIKEYYQNLKLRSNTRRSGALSNNYLNKQLQAMYKLMEYLRKSGRMTLPYLSIDREQADAKPIEVLSVDQIKALYKATELRPNGHIWEAIESRDRAMLSVFYGCGLRRNEGYHLDLSDINFDRRIVHVRYGKAYKERFVPFNKTNAKILEHYIFDHRPFFINAKNLNALFVSAKGYRMQGQSLVVRLKILQQRTDDIELLQKDIALHTLRHSIATHLLKAGMSLEKISRFLGHSTLESTQIYTHLIGSIDSQADSIDTL
jgi:integrase/recombinase XerD